jgi:hypothetical protein
LPRGHLLKSVLRRLDDLEDCAMAQQKKRNPTSEFSRREILSTAAIAGGMLTAASASIAQTSGQAPNPSRGPGIGGTDPAPGDVVRERQNPDMLNPPATDAETTPNLRFSFADDAAGASEGAPGSGQPSDGRPEKDQGADCAGVAFGACFLSTSEIHRSP